MTTKEVVRLFRAKRSGNWKGKPAYHAKCPSHRDRSPSLSITEGANGSTYLHCFRGCTTEEILGAKGMRMGDLFADSGFKPSPEMRRVWADERRLAALESERKKMVIAFADTRPKIPRWLWGDAKDPDEFVRNGGDYRLVFEMLGPFWGADDVPGWHKITVQIEALRNKLNPSEQKQREREHEVQRIIREYGHDELWACLPITRLQARIAHQRKEHATL